MVRRISLLILGLVCSAGLLYVLLTPQGPIPAIGPLLDPVDGLFRTARSSVPASGSTTLQIDGLDAPVDVVRDDRGVPHIFAESDRDAIIALGYVAAQDRLFQMDFIGRAGSGRLSEAFGELAVGRDQFLRGIGMEWGAQKNLERIRQEDGLELDLLQWYGTGVNAYLDALDPADLPVEFRLLDYAPDRYAPIQALRLLQYMNFDLSYRSDQSSYAVAKERFDEETYRTLYPNAPVGLYEPIIPPNGDGTAPATSARGQDLPEDVRAGAIAALRAHDATLREMRGTMLEGFRVGKGSNNWAVYGDASETGAPLLAGDMHLGLSLPPIWYEAHLVTPEMNTYGLTIPGAPILIEAFNDHVGWAFTNTGSDQIDHYALEVNDDRTQYRYDGAWRDFDIVLDTIRVKGGPPVPDTLYYSVQGPVQFTEPSDERPHGAVALQWVGHKPNRSLKALWGMNHAENVDDFETSLQEWDAPMQNILYAGTDGHIAIRSTGRLPVRKAGHGRGLLDGGSDEFAWTGRVPFDELPYARDPEQGFLTSSNQKPTGPDYPHYLGHDWRDGWRSLRLDSLFRSRDTHGVDEFKQYHADVDAQQRDVFVSRLASLTGLSAKADTLRRMLQRWDGVASVDRSEPLVLDVFLDRLRSLTWDEAVFNDVPWPEDAPFVKLLDEAPEFQYFDVQSTPEVETGPALLATALEATADSLEARHGWDRDAWRWGDHHSVVFRHVTQTPLLRPFWRGPFEYPGFASTVSPARGRRATHSASQRVIVDFSTSPPTGIGVVPGGQSGNPLHPEFYDNQLSRYLDFTYYDLRKPDAPDALPDDHVTSRTALRPPQ